MQHNSHNILFFVSRISKSVASDTQHSLQVAKRVPIEV
jgi:hypothetical protein